MKDERTSIEMIQLRQRLEDDPQLNLIWLASDQNLADALTKIKAECRQAMEQYLRTGRWHPTFDPSFMFSEKKSKKEAVNVMRDLELRRGRNADLKMLMFVYDKEGVNLRRFLGSCT